MGLPTPKWGDFAIQQIEYVRNNYPAIVRTICIFLCVISLIYLGYTKITENYLVINGSPLNFKQTVAVCLVFNGILARIDAFAQGEISNR